MSIEEFEKAASAASRFTDEIALHVLGEPLLHPNLGIILDKARAHSLKISLTTNGTLLKSKGELLLSRCDVFKRINISLHSLEANTQLTEFEKSLATCSEKQRTPPGISDKIREYVNECADFAENSAKSGIYTVFRLWNLDSDEGVGRNSQNSLIGEILKSRYPEPWQNRYSGFRLEENTFLEYDGLFTWPTDASDTVTNTRGSCHGLCSQIAILADLTVVPCCLDSNGEIPLGNLKEDSLENILNSARAKNIKDGFKSGNLVEPLCRKCTFRTRFKTRNN